MSNEVVDLPTPPSGETSEASERPAPARRPPRQRLSWAQWATLIAFILCAAVLLAAVAEVARTQFNKGLSFSFAPRLDAPATPEPYVSRGGADLRELAQTVQATAPQLATIRR